MMRGMSGWVVDSTAYIGKERSWLLLAVRGLIAWINTSDIVGLAAIGMAWG
jgi:hypothetical protein